MKRIVLLLVCAIVLTLNICAESVKVEYGTPIVDGVLDNIYTDLSSASYDVSRNCLMEVGMPECKVQATAYYLYDDDYVYICVTVKDSTLMTRGEEYCNNARENNPWTNDATEAYYNIGNGLYKICLDAYGYRMWGGIVNKGIAYFPADDIIGKVQKSDSAYTVEFAVPHELTAGDTVGFSLEVIDIEKDDGSVFYSAGTQQAAHKFVLADKPVIIEAVDTVEVETEESVQTDDSVIDTGIILFAISGAILITIRKRTKVK